MRVPPSTSFPGFRRSVTLLLSVSLLAACSPQTFELGDDSQPTVTDVVHTIAKRQSIGNCWLYAVATWLESLQLSFKGETLDASESYWTWWHFYQQLVSQQPLEELETGGSWQVARSIILSHGVVSEAEFISEESNTEMSRRQKIALETINYELGFGRLLDPKARTPELVRQILDEAFGSNMAAAEAIARPAEELILRERVDGTLVSLRDLLDRRSPDAWFEVGFPRVFGQSTAVSPWHAEQRRRLWKRVFRALNDRQPVVISLMIDFNGVDNTDGTFKGELLKSRGPGLQGGHLTVLEDYSVLDVPELGSIGFGDVSQELKEKALLGVVDRLVVKNSWGVHRPDRGIKDGLTYFDRSYLESQFPWKQPEVEGEDATEWYTTVSSFVLPAGY